MPGVTNRTAASASSGKVRSTIRSSTTAASACFARRGDSSFARSATGAPAGTARVEPSGSVTVTWLMRSAPERTGSGGACCDGWRDEKGAWNMVGTGGLEPPTSCMSSRRSNQLSYAPIFYNQQLTDAVQLLPADTASQIVAQRPGCHAIQCPCRLWSRQHLICACSPIPPDGVNRPGQDLLSDRHRAVFTRPVGPRPAAAGLRRAAWRASAQRRSASFQHRYARRDRECPRGPRPRAGAMSRTSGESDTP